MILTNEIKTELQNLRNEKDIFDAIFSAMDLIDLNSKNEIVVDDLMETTIIQEHMDKQTHSIISKTRSNMRKMFLSLQDLGLGKWIVGRRGFPSRFALMEGLLLNDLISGSLPMLEELSA